MGAYRHQSFIGLFAPAAPMVLRTMATSQALAILRFFLKVLKLWSKRRHSRKQRDVVQRETQLELSRKIERLRARNDEQPVSRLPNELLYHIFLMGPLPPLAASYPLVIRKHCDTKRYIAQVCHHWREVALELPDMWCNAIDLGSGRAWIVEVLKRTRGRPINAFISPGTKDEHIALAFQCRVRRLYAEIVDWNFLRKILERVKELKELEEVELQSCRTRGRTMQLENWLSVPSAGEPSPKYRRLYLMSPFPLPLHPTPSLTCLYISKSWGRKTASQWLDIIRNFPQLQDLSLDGCIEGSGGSHFTSGDGIPEEIYSSYTHNTPVSLPQLRVLQIRAEYFACGSFFRGLALPASCVLRINAHDMSIGPTLDALVAFLQPGTEQPVPVQRSKKLLFFVRASPLQLLLQVSEENAVKLDINLKYLECYEKHGAVGASIFQRLVTAAYNGFQAQGGFATFTVAMSKSLRKASGQYFQTCTIFREVENLRLQDATSAQEFFKFVEKGEGSWHRGEYTINVPDFKSADAIPYPELQWISISQADFEKADGFAKNPYRLVAFVMRRPTMKGVRLIRCTYPQWMIDRLRDLGVEVIAVE